MSDERHMMTGPFKIEDLRLGGPGYDEATRLIEENPDITAMAIHAEAADGTLIKMPAFCLLCGYFEVPGEDFMRHDCDVWRMSAADVKADYRRRHFAEGKRRLGIE